MTDAAYRFARYEPGVDVVLFGTGDKAFFFAEMRDALDTSAARGDPGPLETCLREWRLSAEALSDPQRREVLTRDRPGDADFAEVTRPA